MPMKPMPTHVWINDIWSHYHNQIYRLLLLILCVLVVAFHHNWILTPNHLSETFAKLLYLTNVPIGIQIITIWLTNPTSEAICCKWFTLDLQSQSATTQKLFPGVRKREEFQQQSAFSHVGAIASVETAEYGAPNISDNRGIWRCW